MWMRLEGTRTARAPDEGVCFFPRRLLLRAGVWAGKKKGGGESARRAATRNGRGGESARGRASVRALLSLSQVLVCSSLPMRFASSARAYLSRPTPALAVLKGLEGGQRGSGREGSETREQEGERGGARRKVCACCCCCLFKKCWWW